MKSIKFNSIQKRKLKKYYKFGIPKKGKINKTQNIFIFICEVNFSYYFAQELYIFFVSFDKIIKYLQNKLIMKDLPCEVIVTYYLDLFDKNLNFIKRKLIKRRKIKYLVI
jgi:hypothetical protein